MLILKDVKLTQCLVVPSQIQTPKHGGKQQHITWKYFGARALPLFSASDDVSNKLQLSGLHWLS